MAETIVKFRDVDYPFWNTTIVSDEELKKMGLYRRNIKKNKEQENQKDNFVNETPF